MSLSRRQVRLRREYLYRRSLEGREKEVYEFEQSIKKRHNIIDKKQLKVDKLNRIWAQLKEKGGDDENSGPMEAKKNNIIK